MSQSKIIVGYRTRLVEESILSAIVPDDFEAASNIKDPAKIAADKEARKQKFLAEARDLPYTGTFDAIVLSDLSTGVIKSWAYRDASSGKTPLCVTAAEHILKAHPHAWDGELVERRPPQVVFIGFGMRNFLDMLGLECTLPVHDMKLPPRLWFDNADHRDIGNAVTRGRIPLEVALKSRRPLSGDKRIKWDAVMHEWTEPHQDPRKDVVLAAFLAAQLGFIPDIRGT